MASIADRLLSGALHPYPSAVAASVEASAAEAFAEASAAEAFAEASAEAFAEASAEASAVEASAAEAALVVVLRFAQREIAQKMLPPVVGFAVPAVLASAVLASVGVLSEAE